MARAFVVLEFVRARGASLAWALSVAACGGTVSGGLAGSSETPDAAAGGARGTGGAGAAVGGGGAAADLDAGADPARVAACQDRFDATVRCEPPVSSPEKLFRARSRATVACLAEYALAGARHDAPDVEACAAALDAAGCFPSDGPPPECDLRGSLGGGAPCILGSQCESGRCVGGGPILSPGGPLGATTCGTCAPLARIGESCDAAGCPPGSVCLNQAPSASTPYTCTPAEGRYAGDPCDHLVALCRPGTYCSTNSKQCNLVPRLGESCSDLGTASCVAPAFCAAGTKLCTAPGALGAVCDPSSGRSQCVAGAACMADGTCTEVRFAEPGDVCDGVAVLCRVGRCSGRAPFSSSCPTSLPDGSPCSTDAQCDDYSSCVNTAEPAGATSGVCMPASLASCR